MLLKNDDWKSKLREKPPLSHGREFQPPQSVFNLIQKQYPTSFTTGLFRMKSLHQLLHHLLNSQHPVYSHLMKVFIRSVIVVFGVSKTEVSSTSSVVRHVGLISPPTRMHSSLTLKSSSRIASSAHGLLRRTYFFLM